jgi:hypothetical protein
MSIFDIKTDQYGRTHDHGGVDVSVSPDGLEWSLDVDVDLVVAGDGNTSPRQRAEDFANELQQLVRDYAI